VAPSQNVDSENATTFWVIRISEATRWFFDGGGG